MEGPEICQFEIAVSLKRHWMTDVAIPRQMQKRADAFQYPQENHFDGCASQNPHLKNIETGHSRVQQLSVYPE